MRLESLRDASDIESFKTTLFAFLCLGTFHVLSDQ